MNHQPQPASNSGVDTPSSPAAVRVARLSVALLLTINLFNYIDRYVLAAVLPKIKHELLPGDVHADFWMGTLATAFLVSYMLTAPLFGWLADRFPRWLLIGGAVLVWSVASGESGRAATFTILFVTRMFVGVGEAAYGPTAPTLISDLFPVARRGQVLAYFYMAIPVGSALGFAFGGVMSEHWRWAFYLVVPPGVLLAILCFLMKDPKRGGADVGPVPHRKATLADYMTLLRTRSYVFDTLGMTASTFAAGGIAFWMPQYVHGTGQVPHLAHVNQIFGGLTVVAGLSATLIGGWLGDRLTRRYPGAYFLVSGVSLLLVFPFFTIALYTNFPTAWVWIFLAEFCLFFSTGPSNTILANVTHPSVRATGYAMNILMIHLLGDAISPPLIGLISSMSGGNLRLGFLSVSAATLIGGLLWIWGARYLAEDTRLAPTRLAP